MSKQPPPDPGLELGLQVVRPDDGPRRTTLEELLVRCQQLSRLLGRRKDRRRWLKH